MPLLCYSLLIFCHRSLFFCLHADVSVLLQFTSSNELRLKLVNTGSDTLVFAAEETPLGIDYCGHFCGGTGWDDSENWLGSILMSVREKLVPVRRFFTFVDVQLHTV